MYPPPPTLSGCAAAAAARPTPAAQRGANRHHRREMRPTWRESPTMVRARPCAPSRRACRVMARSRRRSSALISSLRLAGESPLPLLILPWPLPLLTLPWPPLLLTLPWPPLLLTLPWLLPLLTLPWPPLLLTLPWPPTPHPPLASSTPSLGFLLLILPWLPPPHPPSASRRRVGAHDGAVTGGSRGSQAARGRVGASNRAVASARDGSSARGGAGILVLGDAPGVVGLLRRAPPAFGRAVHSEAGALGHTQVGVLIAEC